MIKIPKTAFCLLAICLTCSLVNAQVNLSIAKDQARRVANESRQASAGNSPAGSPAPAAPQQPPLNPALAATLKNVMDLQSDLSVIAAAADSGSAGDQRIPLLNHLSAAAQGTKASSANVRKLAGDLINAMAGHKKIVESDQALARAIHALFNSSHLSAEQQEALLADVKKILSAAEVPADDASKVIEDLKAIATETN